MMKISTQQLSKSWKAEIAISRPLFVGYGGTEKDALLDLKADIEALRERLNQAELHIHQALGAAPSPRSPSASQEASPLAEEDETWIY